MKDRNKVIKTAITGILALATATAGIEMANAAATDKMEKCYGIVKAGLNDCQTAKAACAGSATVDKQSDAFIFLPKGTCSKIAGASLTSTAETKAK